MKKKGVVLLLLTAMLTSVLSACSLFDGKGDTTTGAGDKETGEVMEITWMFWDDLEATEDLITKGYKQVVDRFNEDFAGTYHCNVVTTNLEEYDTKLNALIAAKNTPDVFICNPGPNLTQYVEAGVAADLTEILTEQEKDWYEGFSGGIFEKVTYDGKIMAVPTNFAAACVFYNTEMFKGPVFRFRRLMRSCWRFVRPFRTQVILLSLVPQVLPGAYPW